LGVMHPQAPWWTQSKGEDNGRRRSWARPLVHNISKVEGRVGTLGWELERLTKKFNYSHGPTQTKQ
jgi:hypothetical protein